MSLLHAESPRAGRLSISRPRKAENAWSLARCHPLLALCLYALGALVAQRNAVAHLGSVISGNGVGDPTQFMWTMWWWPHAVIHGVNPFITHAIWAPSSFNLAAVTSTPLPALALAPLTALAGPIAGPTVSYNVANLIAPVLSALAAYRLCLYLTRRPVASILGGWLYGFSSYGLAPLQGHLHLVFTFAPPILVLLSLQLLDHEISRVRYVVLAGLTLSCQLLCGTEMFFTMSVFAGITLAAAVVLAPQVRDRIRAELLPSLALAYSFAGLLCLPFLYYALSGPKVAPGIAGSAGADLLSFFVPGPGTWLGGRTFASLTAAFPLNTSEQGTYLGLPLIAIAIRHWSSTSRRTGTRVLAAVTLIAVVWSLGQSLTIGGAPTLTLPYKLLANAPFFDQILPVRIAVYVALGAAVSASLWLAHDSGKRQLRWILALLAVACLFPNADGRRVDGQAIYREAYRTPAFIADGLYRRYLAPGAVVLPVPFGQTGPSLLWQAQAQGYFRLASGYFGYVPRSYPNGPLLGDLLNNRAPADLQTSTFLIRHHVDDVVVLPSQPDGWPRLLRSLGLRREVVAGIWLYRVTSAPSGALGRRSPKVSGGDEGIG